MKASPGKPGRLQFVDALRGWSVLIMIETHMLNGTLRPELRLTLAYKMLDFVNGLIAPAFLFASGLAFAIAARRKLPDYLSFRWPLLRQFWRLGLLFLIGYGLHIPKFEYHHLRYEAGAAAWISFAQVDVLQCIAMSLLILVLLLLVLRTERRLYTAAAALLAGVVFGSPLIWNIDFWTILPVGLAEYFNGVHASLFPLFPWSAFVLAGALSGYYYMETSRSDNATAASPGKNMVRFAQVALGLVVLSFLIEPLAASLYPGYDYWRSSPSFVMLRLGLVMLACAAAFFYEKKYGISPSSIITISGRESLLVYTVHLMLLYGNFKGPHFVERVGRSFGFLEVFGLSLLLMAAMVLLALAWNAIKHGPLWRRRIVEGGVVAGLAYVFFIGL